jgi:hypothetical protein
MRHQQTPRCHGISGDHNTCLSIRYYNAKAPAIPVPITSGFLPWGRAAAAFGLLLLLLGLLVRVFQIPDVLASEGDAGRGPVDDVVEGFRAARFQVCLQ